MTTPTDRAPQVIRDCHTKHAGIVGVCASCLTDALRAERRDTEAEVRERIAVQILSSSPGSVRRGQEGCRNEVDLHCDKLAAAIREAKP